MRCPHSVGHALWQTVRFVPDHRRSAYPPPVDEGDFHPLGQAQQRLGTGFGRLDVTARPSFFWCTHASVVVTARPGILIPEVQPQAPRRFEPPPPLGVDHPHQLIHILLRRRLRTDLPRVMLTTIAVAALTPIWRGSTN